jgi:hypothetical protein
MGPKRESTPFGRMSVSAGSGHSVIAWFTLANQKPFVRAAREQAEGFFINAGFEAVRIEKGDESQPAVSGLGCAHSAALTSAACRRRGATPP